MIKKVNSIIKRVINAIKEGSFFSRVYGRIKLLFVNSLKNIVTRNIKIDDNKIMFLTFQGDYGCNPKAICNELIKQNKDVKLIWVIRSDTKNFDQYPKEVKLVARNTLELFKEAASTKVFIDNANNFSYMKLKKKKGQVLLQTWHGSMGFKKIETNKNTNWMKKSQSLDNITDYCIVNSKFEKNVFVDTFWPTTDMLDYGHARNDILFNDGSEFDAITKKIKKMYNIDDDVKIALYAPTFRDDCNLNIYDVDYNSLIEALEKRFRSKWCVFVRLHYKYKHVKLTKKEDSRVINVTEYPDIQELMCAASLGITDYSSWMCDYVLTHRPGFLFALDIDKYINERGFYYPLNTTPFPIARNNDELYNAIINFDDKQYENDVNDFLKRMGCIEDGKASQRIVKKIDEIISK